MPTERQVWIIGSIESGARAGDQKFHRSSCFVLGQAPHRDNTQKVRLADLPESFQPCKYCAPARRSTDIDDFGGTPVPEVVGVRPGHTVEVENLETGKISPIRILRVGDQAAPGSVSHRSPRAVALIGKTAGEVAEVELPNGKQLRLRILGFS